MFAETSLNTKKRSGVNSSPTKNKSPGSGKRQAKQRRTTKSTFPLSDECVNDQGEDLDLEMQQDALPETPTRKDSNANMERIPEPISQSPGIPDDPGTETQPEAFPENPSGEYENGKNPQIAPITPSKQIAKSHGLTDAQSP